MKGRSAACPLPVRVALAFSTVVTARTQEAGCLTADPSTTAHGLCYLWQVTLPPCVSASPSEHVNNGNLCHKVTVGIQLVATKTVIRVLPGP